MYFYRQLAYSKPVTNTMGFPEDTMKAISERAPQDIGNQNWRD